MKMAIEKIKIGLGQTLRDTVDQINAVIDAAENADTNASEAKTTANTSLSNSESTQTQLDNIVVSGDSSVEAAQARVEADGTDHTTLKERLDTEHTELSSQLAEIADLHLLQNGYTGGVAQTQLDIIRNAIQTSKKKIKNYKKLVTLNGVGARWSKGETFPIGFTGDSTTSGYGATTTYAGELQKLARRYYFHNNNLAVVRNFGYSGETLTQHFMKPTDDPDIASPVTAARIESVFGSGANSDLKMFGVAFGTNDVKLSGSEVDAFKLELETLVIYLYENGIQPFLLTPFYTVQQSPLDDQSATGFTHRDSDELMNEVRAIIDAVADQYDLEVINSHKTFDDALSNSEYLISGESTNDNVSLLHDGVHPSDLGYRLIASYIFSNFIAPDITLFLENKETHLSWQDSKVYKRFTMNMWMIANSRFKQYPQIPITERNDGSVAMRLLVWSNYKDNYFIPTGVGRSTLTFDATLADRTNKIIVDNTVRNIQQEHVMKGNIFYKRVNFGWVHGLHEKAIKLDYGLNIIDVLYTNGMTDSDTTYSILNSFLFVPDYFKRKAFFNVEGIGDNTKVNLLPFNLPSTNNGNVSLILRGRFTDKTGFAVSSEATSAGGCFLFFDDKIEFFKEITNDVAVPAYTIRYDEVGIRNKVNSGAIIKVKVSETNYTSTIELFIDDVSVISYIYPQGEICLAGAKLSATYRTAGITSDYKANIEILNISN